MNGKEALNKILDKYNTYGKIENCEKELLEIENALSSLDELDYQNYLLREELENLKGCIKYYADKIIEVL